MMGVSGTERKRKCEETFFVVDIRRGNSGREFALFARLKAAELLPTDTEEEANVLALRNWKSS